MAYDFLGLVNTVNRKLNEVELTSANFATAAGFYASAKDAVNSSLRDINQSHFEWGFNHVTEEEVLTVGLSRYSFPADSSTIDFDSFRIKEDTSLGNDTESLSSMTYEEYLSNHVGQEYTSDTSKRGIPKAIVQAPSSEFILVPSPDQAYTLVYEYYRIPVDLENYSDVPAVPERFKHVVIDGAMYHSYMFRGNEQSAVIAKQKFDEGLKRMRTILINRYNYIRSTFIQPAGVNISGARVL